METYDDQQRFCVTADHRAGTIQIADRQFPGYNTLTGTQACILAGKIKSAIVSLGVKCPNCCQWTNHGAVIYRETASGDSIPTCPTCGVEIDDPPTSWSGTGKTTLAYIVNEAHGLRKDSVRQLLVLLERIPEHVVWIFTTTTDGRRLISKTSC